MAHPETESARTVAVPRPDDTPPRNRVIFAYTVMSVIALVALGFLFDSYMDISRRETRRSNAERSWTSETLALYREGQTNALERGRMPIQRAMADFARQNRQAFPLIRPMASDDQGPLEGWNQLPHRAAASAPEEATPEAAAPTDSAPTDAEAAPQGDSAPVEEEAVPAQAPSAP